jgi:hypothetical protein
MCKIYFALIFFSSLFPLKVYHNKFTLFAKILIRLLQNKKQRISTNCSIALHDSDYKNVSMPLPIVRAINDKNKIQINSN